MEVGTKRAAMVSRGWCMVGRLCVIVRSTVGEYGVVENWG